MMYIGSFIDIVFSFGICAGAPGYRFSGTLGFVLDQIVSASTVPAAILVQPCCGCNPRDCTTPMAQQLAMNLCQQVTCDYTAFV